MLLDAKLSPRVLAGLVILLIVMLVWSTVAASTPNQQGYPPPGPESGGVPAVESTQMTTTPAAYPAAGTDLNTQTPVPIGVQNSGQAPGSSPGDSATLGQQTPTEATSRGIVFLWLGFTATFLIFLITVVGSVLLFTRRNES